MNGKRSHKYRVRLDVLNEHTPSTLAGNTLLRFEIQNHDDILAIAERLKVGTPFAEPEAYALAVGVKLFTGVMLAHSSDPLFSDIQPAMRAFIRNLKSQVAASLSSA